MRDDTVPDKNANGQAPRHYGAGEEADICRSMIGLLPGAGLAVLAQDADLVYRWAENVPEGLLTRSPVGMRDTDLLGPDDAGKATETKRRVLSGMRVEPMELELKAAAGGTRWYRASLSPRHDGEGRIDGVLTLLEDVTDAKRREQTLSALMREVSHRSKNLLAIILSIAAQTGRHSPSVDLFLDRFRGRLQSLAYSQDLVTSSNWRGASLRRLVENQTARYVSEPSARVEFHGQDIYLLPNAALHIGLGLHELAVNSANYGGLSRPGGRIMVAIEKADADRKGADGYVLRWEEEVPREARHEERRFGSVMLERVVPAAIGGTAEFGIADGMLSYVLEIPAGELEPD